MRQGSIAHAGTGSDELSGNGSDEPLEEDGELEDPATQVSPQWHLTLPYTLYPARQLLSLCVHTTPKHCLHCSCHPPGFCIESSWMSSSNPRMRAAFRIRCLSSYEIRY